MLQPTRNTTRAGPMKNQKISQSQECHPQWSKEVDKQVMTILCVEIQAYTLHKQQVLQRVVQQRRCTMDPLFIRKKKWLSRNNTNNRQEKKCHQEITTKVVINLNPHKTREPHSQVWSFRTPSPLQSSKLC
jgi:hypothetical protein